MQRLFLLLHNKVARLGVIRHVNPFEPWIGELDREGPDRPVVFVLRDWMLPWAKVVFSGDQAKGVDECGMVEDARIPPSVKFGETHGAPRHILGKAHRDMHSPRALVRDVVGREHQSFARRNVQLGNLLPCRTKILVEEVDVPDVGRQRGPHDVDCGFQVDTITDPRHSHAALDFVDACVAQIPFEFFCELGVFPALLTEMVEHVPVSESLLDSMPPFLHEGHQNLEFFEPQQALREGPICAETACKLLSQLLVRLDSQAICVGHRIAEFIRKKLVNDGTARPVRELRDEALKFIEASDSFAPNSPGEQRVCTFVVHDRVPLMLGAE